VHANGSAPNVAVRKRRKVDSSPTNEHDMMDMRQIFREEMSSLLDDIKTHMLEKFDFQTNEVLNSLTKVTESLNILEVKYQQVKKELDEKATVTNCLQAENKELKTTVTELGIRLSQLEQHSRSTNIEIQ
jgi:6-pyruvoyl-tetrahydropterin synthase